jgi:hypothetical protein
LQAHRQSPSPHHLRKRTRSQGPLLRRHYPASTLQRPCPTPAMAAALRDVEAATLASDGSPLITTNHLSNVPCLLPRRIERVRVSIASLARRSFPQMAGGSASALSLSRPAQALLALRPAGLLSRPRRPLSRGSDPASYPAKPLASFRIQSTTIRVESSSTDDSRLQGALPSTDSTPRCCAPGLAGTESCPGWCRGAVVGLRRRHARPSHA